MHLRETLKKQGSKVAKIAFRRENIGKNHLLPNCAYKYGFIETYSVQTVSFAINMTFFDQCGGGELGPSRCAGLSVSGGRSGVEAESDIRLSSFPEAL